MEYARYAKIPIGNLSTEQDYAIFMTDVQFARYLKQSNQILWMSESTLPDLGGSELVDFSFGTFPLLFPVNFW